MRHILRFGLLCGIVVCLTADPAFVRAESEDAVLSRAQFAARVSALAGLPGKAHEIIRLSDAALAAGTDDPSYAALAHGYKSHGLWLRGDYARAEAEARQAVRAEPGSALAYFFLADALNALLRYDDAYLACLHGADRYGDAARQGEARTRCRDDYARRVTMEPATAIKAAKAGRLSVGKGRAGTPVLVSGRITTVKNSQGQGEIAFASAEGVLICRLAPVSPGFPAPATPAEDGKYPSPAAGLRTDQFVTIRGTVRSVASGTVVMDNCELFTH